MNDAAPTSTGAAHGDRPRPGSGLAPPAATLPAMPPDARLGANGLPRPELRAELRRIPVLRNAWTIASCWAQTLGVLAVAVRLAHPAAWVGAFVLMARAHEQLNILGHEAAHRLLFRRRRVNDAVGGWLLAGPTGQPLELYRRAHLTHHRDELGPEEPDLGLYSGYPITRASLRRKLARDASGLSGCKILTSLGRGLRRPDARPAVLRILACQAVIAAGFTVLGRPELYVLLWFLPWFTAWRVINRLRAIAEHAGMAHSPDRRRSTHVVRQSRAARFLLVPYHVGCHLAHHVDMGVPLTQLPALQRELVASGWVTPELVRPSYRSLWRALSSA
ncbi:MAG: fatty acid desaturase [Acidimicrobiales bacterium]